MNATNWPSIMIWPISVTLESNHLFQDHSWPVHTQIHGVRASQHGMGINDHSLLPKIEMEHKKNSRFWWLLLLVGSGLFLDGWLFIVLGIWLAVIVLVFKLAIDIRWPLSFRLDSSYYLMFLGSTKGTNFWLSASCFSPWGELVPSGSVFCSSCCLHMVNMGT